jgi:single-strand DNA-binding protein
MNMDNEVRLEGRLTRDIETRYTASNEPLCVASFTLAVDRGKDKGADFISCKAFGRTGETMAEHLSKGRKIKVAGHIQTGSYEKKDGTKVYTTDVIVEAFKFQDYKEPKKEEYDGFKEYTDDDDIPF